MRELLIEIRIVLKLLKANLVFRLSHRADFLSALGASMIGTLASFAFLPLLFSRVPGLSEWSPEEVVFLYGFSLVPLGLFNLVSWNLYEFPEKVVFEGRFDRMMLRPQSTLVQVLFASMRIESLQEPLTGILLLGWASHRLGVEWTPQRLLAFVVFAISGGILYVAVFSALTAVSFRFEDRIGLVPPIYNLISFGRYPLTIYSAWIRFLLSTIFPFAFASFYPASRLLGRTNWEYLALVSPLVSLVALTLTIQLWEREVRRYAGAGN